MPFATSRSARQHHRVPGWLFIGAVLCLLVNGSRIDAADETPVARGTAATTAADRMDLQSGPEPGAVIRQFFVRAVTGPHRNRSVCYVCRYGSRPVVMVLVSKLDPRLPQLLTSIDEVVDRKRTFGLRSFGVLITDESSEVVPVLQTLAFDEQIRMPLTAATSAVAGPGGHNLNHQAATTVVLYRDQRAVSSHAFPLGGVNHESIQSVLAGIEQLLSGETTAATAAAPDAPADDLCVVQLDSPPAP